MSKLSPNPYDVLGVSPSASTAEITKAFTQAMKQKKYPMDIIAKARKALTTREERLIADYLRPTLKPIKRFKTIDTTAINSPPPSLEIPPEADGLLEAIFDLDQVTPLDQQLGKAICQNIK